jgi:hypothetical protein
MEEQCPFSWEWTLEAAPLRLLPVPRTEDAFTLPPRPPMHDRIAGLPEGIDS